MNRILNMAFKFLPLFSSVILSISECFSLEVQDKGEYVLPIQFQFLFQTSSRFPIFILLIIAIRRFRINKDKKNQFENESVLNFKMDGICLKKLFYWALLIYEKFLFCLSF